MANWVMTSYDTIAAAEAYIETLDSSTVTLHVFGFKDGAHQKIVVVNSA